jgi:pimeloyl-ACP methyl ester carboxylesterase
MGVARALGWVPVLDRESSRPSSVDAGLFDELGTIGSAPPLIPATLLIHGSGDRIVPVGSSRSAASQNPSIHYIEVPDDHQLVAALPEFLPAVLAFLSRVWPGSDPEGAASAPAQR